MANGKGNGNETQHVLLLQLPPLPLPLLLWGKVAAYVVAGALAICQNGSADCSEKERHPMIDALCEPAATQLRG